MRLVANEMYAEGNEIDQQPNIVASATLTTGGFVTITEQSGALSASVFDATGALVGTSALFATGASVPDVVGTASGGFSVVWTANPGTSNASIQARTFDAQGLSTSGTFTVAQSNGFAEQVGGTSILREPDGDLFITWGVGNTISTRTVMGRSFSETGQALTTSTRLTPQNGDSTGNDTEMLSDGRILVSFGQKSGGFAYTGSVSIYDPATGSVTPNFINMAASSNNKFGSANVTVLTTGNILVLWTEFGSTAASHILHTDLYNSTGTLVLGSTAALADIAFGRGFDVVALPDGGYVVATKAVNGQDSDVFVQRFDANGQKVGAEFAANPASEQEPRTPVLTAFGTGDLAVAWTYRVSDTATDSSLRIYYSTTQGTSAGDLIEGTAGTDVIFGQAGDDNLQGLSGNDQLHGGGDNDTLIGGSGVDALYGDAGNDILDGGVGNDGLFGGDGDDRLVFDAADNPLYVNGGAGDDTLVIWNEPALTTYDLAARGFEGAEVITPDGANNLWTTVTTNFNVDWMMTRRTVQNDDGSRVMTSYDPTNLTNTSQIWSSYDAAGRLTDVDVYFDDGSRTFINHDETGVQSWAQNWFTFDAQGRLDSQDLINDDGTRTFINYDQDNTQSWSQAWFTYDEQGRLDTQDVVADDGSHVFYNWDQAGTEAFQWNAYLYDAQGVAYQQVVHWDDGTTNYYTL